MAKQSYRIPVGLDTSSLDIEISVKSSNGVGFRGMPLRFILCVLASGLAWFYAIYASPVKDFGIPFMVVFTIIWVFTSVILLKIDATGEMAFKKLPVLMAYLPPNARKLRCRSDDNIGPFVGLCNIKEVDADYGYIKFADGDVGYAYRVVGSASILLFKDDREAILDRVESYFRTMKEDYEIIFITAREGQKVTRQLDAMDKRIEKLKGPENRELYELAMMERDCLEDFVGRRFKSIHQYMILKARNDEVLDNVKAILEMEVQSSQLMIKRCVFLYGEELLSMFRSVFVSGEEYDA